MNMNIDKCDYQTIIKYNREDLQTHDTNIEFTHNHYANTTISYGLNPLMFDSNHETPLTNRPSEPIATYSKPQHVDICSNVTILDNPIE